LKEPSEKTIVCFLSDSLFKLAQVPTWKAIKM